ncbi:alpha-hydroxy acid oxidase [Brucella sp. NM4]|uniref:alpha-hydroxy acid oxidase n=1 Tax=Brucella/Ochrobactrum group TaxID=2826938 RepID=UPI0024BC4E92|nr:alpha-hydroxy acid oxidase [Brucella sp. NM4]WHS30272.1 alpha-hydroxy acid oxidase [Brucella sp. NM4]WHT44244.1 alpha-hydroxy acid oxidase [Ochrobactrum sp. SSR]
MNSLLNAAEYREAARRFLPKGLFEYIDRGTEDELALGNLRQDLDRIRLEPRVLRGTTEPDLSTTMLGKKYSTPIVIAPTALAGMLAYQGEGQLARAGAATGIPYCAATQAISSIGEIRSASADADLWFQLYVWKNRELTRQLLARARDHGIDTLVVTTDTPVGPKREYNQRNRFAVPFKVTLKGTADVALHPRWFASVMLRYLLTSGMPTYGNYPPEFRGSLTRAAIQKDVALESNLTWDDIDQLRSWWGGKLILKGILSPEDAEQAVKTGIDGLVISAHGGRNLDIAPTPVQVLPSIRQAVGNRLQLLADSGVMRGTDILKLIALGADGVMIGRLPLWGLASGGEQGAKALFDMLLQELRLAMIMLGTQTLDDLRALRQL